MFQKVRSQRFQTTSIESNRNHLLISDVGANFGFNNTETGWMKGDAFYYFVTEHLYPRWLEMKAEFPIVLVVDGYSSHKNTQLFVWCKEHDVILLLLYPNATHILQVLDVAIFGPLKLKYSEFYEEWKLLHPNDNFTELEFIKVLKATNDCVLRRESIINGWRSTGLQPFEFANVNFDILLTQPSSDQIQNAAQSKILATETQPPSVTVEPLLEYEEIVTIPLDNYELNMDDTATANQNIILPEFSEAIGENEVVYHFDIDDQSCELEIYSGNVNYQ